MKQNTWKYSHVGAVAVILVGASVGCNSHLLLKSGDPEVVVIDPPVVPPPPPAPDAGLTTIFGGTVTLGSGPDAALPDEPAPPPGTDVAPPPPGTDVAPPPPRTDGAPPSGPDAAIPDATKTVDLPPPPPPAETLVCPKGQVRVHVRDLWSKGVSPTTGTLTDPPIGVIIIDPSGSWTKYGARLDGKTDIDGNPPCTYYSVCIPSTVTKIEIQAIGADSCPAGNQSGDFNISSFSGKTEFWIEYTGSSSSLAADLSSGGGKFHMTAVSSELTAKACKVGPPPDESANGSYTKVHFRWPWNDPTNPLTPYAGSACPVDLATKLGFTPPPYPSSLKVTGVGGCELTAMLEFQDGTCPWYYVMIPNASWPATGTAPQIVFRYPDESKNIYTNGIQLPARGSTSEFWIGYSGAPDNKSPPSATVCMDWSLQTNSYFVYTSNPGPGCAGSTVTVDPCSPPQPTGYHTVHFRYIWAGQKTFTMFPAINLMPKWIEMEVNSKSALKVICWREQDRPWFECPVPDSSFVAGATWRAVDKTHSPEWNTVAPRPFPDTPKDYWVRWYYGKPDIPRTVDPPNFMFFDYYPDGTNGDWSATGVWNDSMCAPKPPATSVTVGFGNGAWFPYKKSQYMYPYGGSLAYVYPDNATVQDLFNAFVWERYGIWKQNWVKYDNDACGTGTARVWSDNPEGTVSEGQGYGLAITAAIGDKDLFDKLWNFVRHYRTQARYCGLMGWMWQASGDCQPLDSFATGAGNHDSAFDGDVDIAIGLVYGALQWPEYADAATDWLTRMECEINTKYDSKFNYPTKGDTWNKNCQDANNCGYDPGTNSEVFMDYYPPGYFRVFGDFMAAKLGSDPKASNGQTHHDFWYKTAETVYDLFEKCYDETGVNPGLVGDSGNLTTPCRDIGGGQPYEWGRSLWRVGIDGAWFGNNTSLPENAPNSSNHYGPKSRMQAKIDNSQHYYTNFYKANPVEANANRFSSICDSLGPSGTVTGCDPANGHNSYTVNLAMCSYSSVFDNGGETTADIRREAIEEAITTTIQNDHYFQETLGVYSILFLTGNFPNPLTYSQLP